MSMEGFQRARANYYRKERDRAERCLSNIIATLDTDGNDKLKVEDILNYLIDHYSRNDGLAGRPDQ